VRQEMFSDCQESRAHWFSAWRTLPARIRENVKQRGIDIDERQERKERMKQDVWALRMHES
jgi:hypothetical protein